MHLSYVLQIEPDDNWEEVYFFLLLAYFHECIIMSWPVLSELASVEHTDHTTLINIIRK